MILGFNSEVRYKGRTYHIQTEDSGAQNPVIITHLFSSGTILVTRRTEYGDALGRPDLADHVRALMREQHRTVYEALLAGELDEALRKPPRSAKLGEIPLAKPRAAPEPPPAPARDPEPSEEIPLIDSADAVLLEDEPAEEPPRRGRLAFPTDLLSDAMLDPVILAYLTEDLDEP